MIGIDLSETLYVTVFKSLFLKIMLHSDMFTSVVCFYVLA